MDPRIKSGGKGGEWASDRQDRLVIPVKTGIQQRAPEPAEGRARKRVSCAKDASHWILACAGMTWSGLYGIRHKTRVIARAEPEVIQGRQALSLLPTRLPRILTDARSDVEDVARLANKR